MADKSTEDKRDRSILSKFSSEGIMLEEYRSLHSDYIHQRSEGVTRVNFYITAMSVILGGALIFASSDSQLIVPFIKPVLFASSVLLFTIGIDVYNYLIQRDLATDRHIRGMARVRNYFIKFDSSIKDHFINNIYDTPTGYLIAKSSGMRRTTEVIIGFWAGLGVSVFVSYYSFLAEIYIPIGAVTGIITALLLEIRARRKLDKALEKAIKEMRFEKRAAAK